MKCHRVPAKHLRAASTTALFILPAQFAGYMGLVGLNGSALIKVVEPRLLVSTLASLAVEVGGAVRRRKIIRPRASTKSE